MKYRLYFVYPAPEVPIMPGFFEPDGLVKYYHWLKELLKDDLLGSGLGFADMAETQPIFGNTYNALMYLDFKGRLEAFDSIDKHGFVDVLDRMLEFTDTPPVLQGVFMVED